MERPKITNAEVCEAFAEIQRALDDRIRQHGDGSFASRAEATAVIEEEMREVWDALRKNDVDSFLDEVADVAVGCLWALACRKHMRPTSPAKSAGKGA